MDLTSRRGFLNLAAAFEGGTLAVALSLGWLSGTFTPHSLQLNAVDFGWGVAAVLPMLVLLVAAQDLRQQVVQMLGQSLASCRWYDLAALAILAGVSEELLFRGVLEPWIGRWDPWAGVVLANILFGLAHAVSPTYFLFAALVGIYFSLLNHGWIGFTGHLGQPNLLRPVIAHGVYDFIAFLLVVKDYRRGQSLPVPTQADE